MGKWKVIKVLDSFVMYHEKRDIKIKQFDDRLIVKTTYKKYIKRIINAYGDKAVISWEGDEATINLNRGALFDLTYEFLKNKTPYDKPYDKWDE